MQVEAMQEEALQAMGASDAALGGRIGRLQQLLVEAGNLTGAEARVLVVLLGLRTGSLKQLSEATGTSRSNIYPLLESLSAKGLCRRRPGKHALWECPEPKEVVARLRGAEEARLHAGLEAAAQGFDEAEAIVADPFSGNEDPPITLEDDARLGALYLDAMASVEAEVLVLNRGPYPGDLAPNPSVLEALARGVKARALYVSAELDAPDGQLRQCADAYAEAGVEQRVVDSLPVAMAVIGEETALLSMPGRSAGAAVRAAAIRHDGVVELLTAAFDHLWERAHPYNPTAPAGADLRLVDTKVVDADD